MELDDASLFARPHIVGPDRCCRVEILRCTDPQLFPWAAH